MQSLAELHFAGFMLVGFFVSLSLLALRPYFRIQASRFLAATVFLPLPLYAMLLLTAWWWLGKPYLARWRARRATAA